MADRPKAVLSGALEEGISLGDATAFDLIGAVIGRTWSATVPASIDQVSFF